MKQKKIPLIQGLVKQFYPGLRVPERVRNLRPFYEGVIAYHQCRGRRTNGERRRIDTNYKENSENQRDWEIGWTTASEQKPIQKPKSFPFQHRIKEDAA